jgi:DNA (cytosine-5)-methyltransferase 1
MRYPRFPLASGAEARVQRLKGYGDAIVAPQAAEFIAAYMKHCKETA